MIRYIYFVFIVLLVVGCQPERVYTPKPRMYPRVVFPERSYEMFELEACNFKFKRPSYAKVETGINFFEEDAKHPCWFDLEIEELNTSIHFSYTPVGQGADLEKLVTDAFKIVAEHNAKAEYSEESLVENRYGVKGLMFNIDGPVASPINFFLTDTTQHFVRASLYINSKVNPDSSQVVLDFVSKDIDMIISSFEWLD